jgi:hypothetical protein
VEELEEVDVVLLLAEVLFEEEVDSGLEHEGVIDGDVGDTLLKNGSTKDRKISQETNAAQSDILVTHDLVPAGLATTGDGLVHHVIGNEEVGLELCLFVWASQSNASQAKGSERTTHELDAPSEDGSLEVLLLSELGARRREEGIGVDD